MKPETKPAARSSAHRIVSVRRGIRCGVCYWALYDGWRCQNKDCACFGKEPPHNIRLSNEEAQWLIQMQHANDKALPRGGAEGTKGQFYGKSN
jgi:hypothetical protein